MGIWRRMVWYEAVGLIVFVLLFSWFVGAIGAGTFQDPPDPPTVLELTNQMWAMQNTLDACCEQLTRPDGEFRESFEEYVRLRGQLHELELRVETLEGGPK